MEKSYINTVYIMSKGRPNCVTARMLSDINYPGEWFIVCGDNDETYPEYVKNWGKDKVLLFDWAKKVQETDLLDPFGVENKPSGAAPARNAIHDISHSRGEKRHWQFDDDISIFYDIDDFTSKKIRIEDGRRLFKLLERVARFGEEADLADVGVSGATLFVDKESKWKADKQVFVCHNLRSDDRFIPWRGRMADDLVQAIDTAHTGRGIQLSIKYFGYAYASSAKNPGGNTDLYNSEGYIRKAGYTTLVDPLSCRVRIDDRGPHVQMNYPTAKIINERFKR